MADESAKAVGNRIRKRRKALGLSQAKLAKRLKVPQQTIGGWETGKAAIPRRLVDAAQVLCTSPEWLLRAEGPEVVVPQYLREELTSRIDSLDPQRILAVLQFLDDTDDSESEAA